MKPSLFKSLAIVATLAAGAAGAQSLNDLDLPEGAIAPSNLSQLGDRMKGRVSDIVLGDEEHAQPADISTAGLNMFSGSNEEDPIITEIKGLAKELDTQRLVMLKIDGLQQALISFARTDPQAAIKSRLPVGTCELAIDAAICDKMSWSFLTSEDIIVNQN